MIYMGSKRRIAKEIMPIILAGRTEGQLYVEPFVGGANSFEVAANPRLGADNNKYLIAYHRAVASGWLPPASLSREEYHEVKNNREAYDPALVGFAGFPCSFGAKFFGGYASNKTGQNYARAALGNAINQAPLLQGASFVHADYQMLDIPHGSIVYCDPPYAGTTKYHSGFDHVAFWSWAADVAKHSRVFVSEYTAPAGWRCVWEKKQTTTVARNTGYKDATERLFVPDGQS